MNEWKKDAFAADCIYLYRLYVFCKDWASSIRHFQCLSPVAGQVCTLQKRHFNMFARLQVVKLTAAVPYESDYNWQRECLGTVPLFPMSQGKFVTVCPVAPWWSDIVMLTSGRWGEHVFLRVLQAICRHTVVIMPISMPGMCRWHTHYAPSAAK